VARVVLVFKGHDAAATATITARLQQLVDDRTIGDCHLATPHPSEPSNAPDDVLAVARFSTDAVPTVAELDAWSAPATPLAYLVDERIPWRRAGATDQPPITAISFTRRQPALTRAEFAAHWLETHAPLAEVHHPGIDRYRQNIVIRGLTPGAPEVDGIAELSFASVEARNTRMYDSPAGQAVIGADVATFMVRAAGWRILAVDSVLAAH
jgi:uncharacterized protein (TIGR02118 family)